ncbi:MAG: hypothetical protein IJ459_06145 [Clostridia bacterium]|nr:hypothetical protein [Clostridia bacterium]
MNMFDEARAIRAMMEMCAMTQDGMAKKLGVSQSYVANKLRLLKLPCEFEKRIVEGGLSERHARALLRLDDPEARRTALDRICERRLNVAEAEALVDMLHDGQAPKRIGKATKLSRIDTFIDTVKQSLKTLSSLGIDAKESISYYGSKTYITISIDEA